MFPYWKTCKARKHLAEFGEIVGVLAVVAFAFVWVILMVRLYGL